MNSKFTGKTMDDICQQNVVAEVIFFFFFYRPLPTRKSEKNGPNSLDEERKRTSK
jgi:hypothetical protein